MKTWAISLFKVPSYLEAFAKELRSTYPGISFFTRYTVHCALYIVQCVQCTAYMVHMKSFSLCETLIGFVQFVLPVKSGWRMPQTNKCLKQTPLQILKKILKFKLKCKRTISKYTPSQLDPIGGSLNLSPERNDNTFPFENPPPSL